MKKAIFISMVAILLTGGIVYSSMASVEKSKIENKVMSRIKIYLKNDCSSDVDVYVKSPGSSTTYTIKAGYKTAYEFLDGTKVYDEDGRDLIVEVTSSCSGNTYYVCE